MTRVAIEEDEWYPYYRLVTPDSYDAVVDLPDEVIERHRAVHAQFVAAQRELAAWHELAEDPPSPPSGGDSRVSDEKEAAVRRAADAIFMDVTHYDTPTMDGSDLDYAVAVDAERHARLAFAASGMWERIEELKRERVELWDCPDCAFTFDAIHKDADDGYSCPACAEDRLRADNERLREALSHIARARVLPQWAWQVARTALAETQENAEC